MKSAKFGVCLPCPRSINSAGPGPVGRDCGAEKADKIAFLANYTKSLEIIGLGGYMEIKSKLFGWFKNGRSIADMRYCEMDVHSHQKGGQPRLLRLPVQRMP